MQKIIDKLKVREIELKNSIAKVRGILEFDRDKINNDQKLLYELSGKLNEVQELLKELENKKVEK